MKLIRRCKRAIKRALHEPEPRLLAVPQPVNAQRVLEGKIALITGGSSGIGWAIAKAFVNSGCKVILAGRNPERLRQRCAELAQGAAAAIELDVCDVASLPEKVCQAAKLFPEGRIDILVNSAGLVCHRDFLKVTPEEYLHGCSTGM